jgi:hypothetical protein
MSESKRVVGFPTPQEAEMAGAIAERICEDVMVDGSKVTLVGDDHVIHSTLVELEYQGLSGTALSNI